MAADPVRTTNLPPTSAATELLVNFDTGPAKSTGRMPLAAARQLLISAVAPPVSLISELSLSWPAGVEARVYGEANTANNGVYRKNGASGAGGWVRIGPLPAGDIADVNRKTAEPSNLSFQDPIIEDIRAVVNGTPTIFVPRQCYFSHDGAGAISTNGTESPDIAGYVGVVVPAVTQCTVYFDADDGITPYKTVVYPAVLPVGRLGRIRVIGVCWAGHFHCAFDFESTDRWGEGRLIFRTPPVVEGSKLLIPAFYRWFPNTSTSLVFMTPADGTNYWQLDISTSASEERRHYFDLTAALAGSTPVKTVIATAVPRMGGGGRIHLIATSINGRVTGRNGYRIVGGGNGGVIANEFDYALGADADKAPFLFTGTTIGDITDPLLTARSFTRGFVSLAANRPYGGAALKNPRRGYFFFARAYYEATADDTFATARVYLRKGSTVLGTFNGVLEEKLSARVRIYSISGQIPLTGDIPDNFIIGMEAAAGSVTRVCGVQFGVSADVAQWIARGDYTPVNSPTAVIGTIAPAVLADVTPASLAVGPDVWLTEGRPLPVYLQSLFAERSEGMTIAGTLSSVGTGGYPHVVASSNQIMLDPARLGAAARLDVRHSPGNKDRRWRRDFNVHVASAAATGSPKILMIGDSLSNRGAAAWLKARLVGMGLTPTFIGTMLGQGLDGGDLTGELGEAREGVRFAEMIYQATNRPAVAPGGEAAYLAKTKANRMLDNPFVRVAIGGDDPAHVFNGHIFDLAFYLSRFSFATPDIVIIALGTNDFAQGTPTQSLDWVKNGLKVMVAQARAAAPGAEIGLLIHGAVRSSNGDGEWPERYAAICEHIRFVTAAADPKLRIIPAWQHMSPEIGWGDTLAATDQITGTQSRDWSDTVHFLEFQRRIVAEMTASWIVNRLSA